MEKEMAAKILDTSPKNMHKFRIKTPGNNEVSGLICKNRGEMMGSLFIGEVNGTPVGDYFVHGMSKIRYFDHNRQHFTQDLPDVFMKADGTNILAWPVIENGEIIETMYKTRMVPELKDKFYEKVLAAGHTENIHELVVNSGNSYSFELYGTENPHTIKYDKLGIKLRMDMLCGFNGLKLQDNWQSYEEADTFGIPFIEEVFYIDKITEGYIATPSGAFLDKFGQYMKDEKELKVRPSIEMLYNDLEMLFERINFHFGNGFILEGAVWYANLDDEYVMLKNKPPSMRDAHQKAACGIPHFEFKKALDKADENLTFAEGDMGESDKDMVFEFVKQELLEDYEPIFVDDIKTQQKFNSIFAKRIRKVEIDASLQEIADAVKEAAGEGLAPADYMRKFAMMYPDMRSKSRAMFGYFQ